MYQYWLSYNKHITPKHVVNNRGNWCVWGGFVGTVYLPFNFSAKLKLFLKKSVQIVSVSAILPLPQLSPQWIRWLKRLDQFSSIAQSCPTLCDPMDCRCQASLSITNSQSLLKLMSESVMPSNLCCPLLLPPSICPSIRVFSNEPAFCIR